MALEIGEDGTVDSFQAFLSFSYTDQLRWCLDVVKLRNSVNNFATTSMTISSEYLSQTMIEIVKSM